MSSSSSSSLFGSSTAKEDDDDKEEASAPTTKVFIVNWEGCLANTVDWRINTAIQVALATWPEELQPLLDSYSNDIGWLRRKLTALAPVFTTITTTTSTSTTKNQRYSVLCDYSLAVRMILEEQELDQKRSNGKMGKYSKKFHPRQQQQSVDNCNDNDATKSSSTTGTRPLTVGEILSHWCEGAMIRETLQTRYHVQFQDPMPILQENINTILLNQQQDEFPEMLDPIRDILMVHKNKKDKDGETFIIVTVDHPSDLTAAQKCLQDASIDFELAQTLSELFSSNSNSKLKLISKQQEQQQQQQQQQQKQDSLESKQPQTIRIPDVIAHAPKYSTTYVLDSSWYALQYEIQTNFIFGDSIPLPQNDWIGKCFCRDKYLSALCLTQWSSSSSSSTTTTVNNNPNQQAAATMNPWARLFTLQDFQRCLLNTSSFRSTTDPGTDNNPLTSSGSSSNGSPPPSPPAFQ